MIACLGETTGEDALWTILDTMQASEEGQRIMADKPRIHTSTIDFKYLETLPPDTFGAAYVKFLKDNVSSSKNPVRKSVSNHKTTKIWFKDIPKRIWTVNVMVEFEVGNN